MILDAPSYARCGEVARLSCGYADQSSLRSAGRAHYTEVKKLEPHRAHKFGHVPRQQELAGVKVLMSGHELKVSPGVIARC